MALTLKRVRELERQLELMDAEIDSILQEYYLKEGGQNIGGRIAEISRMHAELVELLADKKRELATGKK